jgi:hypothetical protein
MDNLQPEHLLEHIEVAVAMQKFVAGEQAESGDPTIDRLANCESALAEGAVILGSCDGQFGPAAGEHSQLHEFITDMSERSLSANTLQHFAQNQVRKAQPIATECPIQPGSFVVDDVSEIVDPYGSIDDHHAPLSLCSAAAGLVEIAFPMNFAFESPD